MLGRNLKKWTIKTLMCNAVHVHMGLKYEDIKELESGDILNVEMEKNREYQLGRTFNKLKR